MLKPIDEFHIEYEKNRIWEKTNWLGVPCWKLPFDAWIMQEIIFKTRPEFIIETGTGSGGSALLYASIMELVNCGKVITVDIKNKVNFDNYTASKLWDKRVTSIIGNSLDPRVIDTIMKIMGISSRNIMVILDSWHAKEHVLEEIYKYSPLVALGNYLIVEDTHINGHPVPWDWGSGPYEAVEEFLRNNKSFIVEKWCEKLGFTFNPSGYLRRIR